MLTLAARQVFSTVAILIYSRPPPPLPHLFPLNVQLTAYRRTAYSGPHILKPIWGPGSIPDL